MPRQVLCTNPSPPQPQLNGGYPLLPPPPPHILPYPPLFPFYPPSYQTPPPHLYNGVPHFTAFNKFNSLPR
ncbi:hypothetical protein M8J76_002869 [Diaphorina citri]|nr:hypothetical protein M8J76_002869 [Diaphorina citri]